MKIREDITIELTPSEVRKILKDHFSDKYDINDVQFNIGTVYDDDGMPVSCVGTDEVTGVRLLGKNKQK